LNLVISGYIHNLLVVPCMCTIYKTINTRFNLYNIRVSSRGEIDMIDEHVVFQQESSC
jgi:hypothetical protein